jgi:hypothetical protein
MAMASPNDRVGQYFRVDDKDNSCENEADYFIPDSENAGRRRRGNNIWSGLKLLIWTGQALLLAANIYGLTVTTRAINRDSVSSRLKALSSFRA